MKIDEENPVKEKCSFMTRKIKKLVLGIIVLAFVIIGFKKLFWKI